MRSSQEYLSARRTKNRRGSIVVLTAVLMVVLMALLAFSIDTGYMYSMKTELDRAVDAAALAGTSVLVDGDDAAQDMVVEYLARNPLGKTGTITVDSQLAELKSQWLKDHEEELELTFGYWNPATHVLEEAGDPTAVKVVVAQADLPLFFGRALGRERFQVQSSSIATYKPRDIMLVLDLSASMNNDSEFKSISSLGRETVEDNLEEIYYELDAPQYGNLPFQPEYATVIGVPPVTGSLPQITVEYRGNSVYITSSKDVSNVVLELADGTFYRDESFQDGDTETTMTMNQTIVRAWVKSGTNAKYFENTNGYGELYDFTLNETFIGALELTEVLYPCPSGSWSEYIDYVKSSGTANADAGYQYKFGSMNLINYWLERQPAYSQTPDLWKVSAQPLATVKDAVDLFVDYVREINTRDRIGLAVYNSATGEGSVEVALSPNLDQVVNVARERQAGHYHSMTNVGGGLSVATDELHQHGRDGAFKMIIVLTDGAANWANGVNDPAAATSYAITEATRASDLQYNVMTISLGQGADTSLMQQVADIADGIHFNVPGGATVQQTRDALIDAFREIARKRPVTLVQ